MKLKNVKTEDLILELNNRGLFFKVIQSDNKIIHMMYDINEIYEEDIALHRNTLQELFKGNFVITTPNFIQLESFNSIDEYVEKLRKVVESKLTNDIKKYLR